MVTAHAEEHFVWNLVGHAEYIATGDHLLQLYDMEEVYFNLTNTSSFKVLRVRKEGFAIVVWIRLCTNKACCVDSCRRSKLNDIRKQWKRKCIITNSFLIIMLIIMFNTISIALISMWICSKFNALYNSRGNQISISQITILQLLLNKSNQIKCWFLMRGENRIIREKTSQEQGREPANSIHIWRRVRKLNLEHIGTKQVLSPLSQPCHLIPVSRAPQFFLLITENASAALTTIENCPVFIIILVLHAKQTVALDFNGLTSATTPSWMY